MMIRNYGLKLDIKDIQPEDYTLAGGQLGGEVLQTDRNWKLFLPRVEIQYNTNLDTNACYIYGSMNMLEIVMARKFGGTHNFAERFVAYFTKHNFIGGNPHDALEVIRKEGEINEDLLPFTNDVSKGNYLVAKMPISLTVEGRLFLNNYKINHDWVFLPNDTGKAETIWSVLQYSPVGVSVLAWIKDKKYYTKPKGATDSHWCVIINGEYGKYWEVFDTYDESIKKLEWDYDFNFGKRIIVEKITSRPNWLLDLFNRTLTWLKIK